MRVILGLFWIITLLASIVAGIELLSVLAPGGAASAPQQAAGAAIAIGTAVIPYVFTRACEGIARPGRSDSQSQAQ